MKLYKDASGKQIIKLSKKEWINIGKRAKWIKESSSSNIDPVRWHQINVAKKVLQTSDAMSAVLGGPTKQEARKILRDNGWSNQRIAALEAK